MLHTEGGARQNCVAAEPRGEAAIASDCTLWICVVSTNFTIGFTTELSTTVSVD
jgi:hypothetical protein